MNENQESKLSRLLQAARPTAALPPGFQRQVWQRIERGEQGPEGLIERLARWMVMPRVAVAALAAVVLLAAGLGASHGMKTGEQAARNRYLAAVDPAHFEP